MPTIIGSNGSDTITPHSVSGGVTGDNTGNGHDGILGLGGDDFIIGGGGDDMIFADGSSAGYDRVSYDGALGGVTVDLGARSSSGAAGNDSLVNVDVVYGSGHDDLLLTGVIDRVELLAGENGHDTLSAADGISAPGSLFQLRGGIHVGSGQTGYQYFYGDDGSANSYFQGGADTLVGGEGTLQEFQGGGGNDLLRGGSGQDQRLIGDDGTDQLYGGNDADSLVGGSGGGQSLYGEAGHDTLVLGNATWQAALGGEGNDCLLGSIHADTLQAGTGDDTLNGGNGSYWADYIDLTAASQGVTINLGLGTSGGDAGSDLLISIENLRGDSGDDSLFDSSGANTLEGGAGDDTLNGGGGLDRALGGAGNDYVHAVIGLDTGIGGSGNDVILVGGADLASVLALFN